MVPCITSTGESALVGGGFVCHLREKQRKNNMKALKFMLATATAIGLTTASQAVDYPGSTNFEDLEVGALTVSGFFQFDGAAGDNESEVIGEAVSFAGVRPFKYAETPDTKYLKVSTGTDPLLRKVHNSPVEGNGVYIDTLVQFTVTPSTDEVTTNAADKLLIYLKEDGNGATNLYVKAAKQEVKLDGFDEVETFDATDVSVTNIVAGAWYRLTVKSNVEDGLLYFNIWLDGIPLKSSEALYQDANQEPDFYAFPSLLGRDVDSTDEKDLTELAAVGFAGEGCVDDLAMTTVNPFNPALDFTLAWPSGVSPVSYTIGAASPVDISSETSPLHIAPNYGQTVSFIVANADGAQKTLTVTAGDGEGQATGIDADGTTFGWPEYLGAAVDGAYVIDNLAELVLFKKGVAKLGTSGETFKLGADIDATDLGYFDGIGTANGTNGSSGLNNCTFDGAGYTISNVAFTPAKYRGFFNQVLNSTIQNLTINVVDIQQTDAAEHGYSAFAGNMKNSKIQNCVATGTIGTTAKPAMHTCGGFAVKSAGGNVFENCTNYVDVVCSLNDNPKIGGIVGLAQDGAAAFTNCWNYGDMTITCTKCANAGNGAGGLVGYGSKAITIYGGGNAGTIQSTNTTADGGTYPIKIGTIIAMQNDASATVSGGVVAQADAAPAGAFANISGLDFATVDGTVATFADTLAAGNTYKVMNAAATATYEFTAAGTIAFDTTLAAPTYAITAASGLAADSFTSGNVKTYYATDWAAAPAEHPWYENPAAVVLAQDLPHQGSKTGDAFVSAFHGQGEGEYLGLTYSTNPLQFDLFGVDGTNALTTIKTLASSDASLNMPGFRGVAISKTLGIAMTFAYYAASNMYAFPLTGGAATVVVKPSTHAFDAGAFSPDGRYFFSNAIAGESANTYYVKWSVSVADGGVVTLTKVGSIAASGRGRSLAYARINGRDLVFGLVDSKKVAVIDMTGDTAANWTATDMITDLPAHSYGTLCVSGVKVTGGTPHLTVVTAITGASVHTDVLNVYALTVPATGTVTASLTKTFNEAALTEAGFGDISDESRYGNTVYVTEDEATIYFARPDNKLYAAQYAAPAQTGEEVEPGQQSTATYTSQADAEAALANVTIVAPEDVATNAAFTAEAKTAYLEKFEKKVVSAGEGEYKVEVALTAAAAAALQTEVDADAAEVVEDLSEATVTLTTTPGFYYSFLYGTSLDNMQPAGTPTLATGTTLTLTRPTTANATSGFFKVVVTVTP